MGFESAVSSHSNIPRERGFIDLLVVVAEVQTIGLGLGLVSWARQVFSVTAFVKLSIRRATKFS
jgi:hypothetical protein